MYCLRLVKQFNKERLEQELTIDLTRRFMALFANANRSKTTPVFEPAEMLPYKLSFDKDAIVEERPMTFKEAKALLGSRIKKDGKQ